MFNYMVDVFFFDNVSKKIYYYENILFNYIFFNEKFLKNEYIYVIKLSYGEKNYDLKTLGNFNKFNPSFLHPEIDILKKKNNKFFLNDKIFFEENLTASFLDKEIYLKKIYKTLKYLNLSI